MNFKLKLKTILQKLGWGDTETLTNEQITQLQAEYKALYNASLSEDMTMFKAEQEELEKNRESVQFMADINAILANATGGPVADPVSAIKKLTEAPEEAYNIAVIGSGTSTPKFFMDKIRFSNLSHNKMAVAMLSGRPMMGDTINVDDVLSEFGQYLTQTTTPILRSILQTTDTLNFVRTIPGIRGVYRASTAKITSVLQSYTDKWTPKGKLTLIPAEIPQRRHKINVVINPNDIYNSWVGFLYNEKIMEPADHPISLYIINNFIVPQLNEDRELKMFGHGVYVEPPITIKDGDEGRPAEYAADGYMTILTKEYAKSLINKSEVNFITLSKPWSIDNSVDNINEFCDSIPDVIMTKLDNIFVSNDMALMYYRGYEKMYETKATRMDNKGYLIDYYNKNLTPLPSMLKDKSLFLTATKPGGLTVDYTSPGNNFIRIIDQNDGAQAIRTINDIYHVKCLGEYHEALGFEFPSLVYCALDIVQQAANDGTPDATEGFRFQLNANTSATAITDIANAKAEQIYHFIGNGSGTNDTTIAKTGKFASLTSTWTAKKGNILIVQYTGTEFKELYSVNN